MYDTWFREYHPTLGRWISPDPAGLGAVDPTNPQTWNRYAYVLNNPMAMVDLLGDDGCYDAEGNQITATIEATCPEHGGLWLDSGLYVDNGAVYQQNVPIGVNDATGEYILAVGPQYAGSYTALFGYLFSGPSPSPLTSNVNVTVVMNYYCPSGCSDLSPSAQAAMVAIHSALVNVPMPCGASATGSVGKEGKDVGLTVSSNGKNMIDASLSGPVKSPPVLFDFGIPKTKTGFQVYGGSWHSVTGVGFTARAPKVDAGLSGQVSIGNMDSCQ